MPRLRPQARARDESGELPSIPPLIRLHLLRAILSHLAARRRARYHNVTTRDSLALLLKVKIPVGAGAILRRASLQALSSSRYTLLSHFRLTLSSSLFLPSLARFAFFHPFFSCKLVQTFIGAILCVHNGRALVAIVYNSSAFSVHPHG